MISVSEGEEGGGGGGEREGHINMRNNKKTRVDGEPKIIEDKILYMCPSLCVCVCDSLRKKEGKNLCLNLLKQHKSKCFTYRKCSQ